MSYIITAKVYKSEEVNCGGCKKEVKASVLQENDEYVVFDVPGKFGETNKRTTELCKSLINSGFYSFEINHSYWVYNL